MPEEECGEERKEREEKCIERNTGSRGFFVRTCKKMEVGDSKTSSVSSWRGTPSRRERERKRGEETGKEKSEGRPVLTIIIGSSPTPSAIFRISRSQVRSIMSV